MRPLLESDLWEQSQELLESLSARSSGIDISDSEMQDLLIEVVDSTSGKQMLDVTGFDGWEEDGNRLTLWIYHYAGGGARNTDP